MADKWNAPIDFGAYIAERTRDFTGRGWVFAEIDEWLSDTNASRFFLLTGNPGTGKTAIAARLVQMSRGEIPADDYSHIGKDSLAYYHFCQTNSDATLNPLRFVETLSRSLANRFDAFCAVLLNTGDKDIIINTTQNVGEVQPGSNVQNVAINSLQIGSISPRSAFDRVVRLPLEALYTSGFDQALVILVDSMDEALTFNPDENLVSLMERTADFPKQVRFLLTSRGDKRVQLKLGKASLDLIDNAPGDIDDVGAYARRRLESVAEPQRGNLAARIAKAGEGNFLYARYVLDDLLPRIDQVKDLDELPLPDKLEGVYREFLQRELAKQMEQWDTIRPLMGALAVARGTGLTRTQLAGITQLPLSKTDSLLRVCMQYLEGPEPEGPFRIYHQSFRDFLLGDLDFQVYPEEAHQRLADFFLNTYGNDWTDCRDAYALRNTPFHLAQVTRAIDHSATRHERNEKEETLTTLLTDLRFIESRLAEMAIYDVLSDMKETSKLLPETASPNHRLSLILTALDLEAHNLRIWHSAQYPALLAQQLYNRTRGEESLSDFTAECIDRLTEMASPYFERLWSARRESAVLVRVLDGHDGSVNTLAITTDEQILISGGSDGVLSIWDLSTGRLNRKIEPSSQGRFDRFGRNMTLRGGGIQWSDDEFSRSGAELSINALVMLPDDQQVWVGRQMSGIEVLNIKTGEYTGSRLGSTRTPILSLVQSPDGRRLMAFGDGESLWLYYIPEAHTQELRSDTGYFTAVGMASKLALLATVGRQASYIELVDLDTLRTVLEPIMQEQIITGIAVTPNGSIAVTADVGGLLRVWDLSDGRETCTLHDWESLNDQDLRHRELIDAWLDYLEDRSVRPPTRRLAYGNALQWHSVALSPNGRLAFSSLPDGRLHLWDLQSKQLIGEIDAHRGAVRALNVSPTGRYGVSGAEDGKIKVWDLGTPIEQAIPTGHRDWVNALIFTSDGKLLVSGSDDGTIRIWDCRDGKELRRVSAHEGWVLDFALSNDGQTLFSAGGDGTIKSWDLSKLNLARIFAGHDGRVHGVRLTPQGEMVSAGADQTLRVWNLDTGNVIHVLRGHEGKVIRVAPIPNRRQVISGSEDATLRVWDLETGQEVRCLRGHEAQVDAVVVTSDGNEAISTSYDGTIRSWNLENWQCDRVLRGHQAPVYKVALSIDETHIFSVSADNTVRAWERGTGTQVAVIPYLLETSSIATDPQTGTIAVSEATGNIYLLRYHDPKSQE